MFGAISAAGFPSRAAHARLAGNDICDYLSGIRSKIANFVRTA
jgi:hypothetical protein